MIAREIFDQLPQFGRGSTLAARPPSSACTQRCVAPDYVDAAFNLALLLQRTNQYAEAADYWRPIQKFGRCELSFKSVDRNSSDVTKLDASSPQKRTPSGKCLGILLPHWTGRHGCRGMGVPPILVPEQQCADKVQSRACEFSFSHLFGSQPETCSPLRSLMSQTRLTLRR
jgi:hypothetical protein